MTALTPAKNTPASILDRLDLVLKISGIATVVAAVCVFLGGIGF